MRSKINNRPILTALLVSLLVVGCPLNADAQFLDKLNKGLEKLNKGLDKVENALKGKKSKSKAKATSPPLRSKKR